MPGQQMMPGQEMMYQQPQQPQQVQQPFFSQPTAMQPTMMQSGFGDLQSSAVSDDPEVKALLDKLQESNGKLAELQNENMANQVTP